VALLPAFQGDLQGLEEIPAYSIELSVDPALQTFQGRSRLQYTNTEDTSLERLYFRLLPNGGASYGGGTLAVSEAKVNGEVSQFNMSLDDSVLELVLPELANPFDDLMIDFDFSGKLSGTGSDAGYSAGYGMYSHVDGTTTMAGWFPQLAVYDRDGWHLDPVSSIGDSVFSDTCFYSVDIHVPDGVILTATGVQTSRVPSADGITYQFISGPARDFVLVMSPDFKITSTTVDGTTINSYSLPGHRDASQQALDIAAASVRAFNERIGQYPFTELDVVETPLRGISGVEFPGIVLIRSSYYDTPEDPVFPVLIAHEVAHQWWYNLVGNDVFEDPWLDEALTSYTSSLYFEQSGDRSAAAGLISYWQNDYLGALSKGQDDLVTESLAHFENQGGSDLYGDIVYSKGALFFDALRDEIGDEAFFQALQRYFELNKYRIATPDDLLEQFETTASRQLDDLYLEWLYSKQQATGDDR
jgi:aminopeptidase N